MNENTFFAYGTDCEPLEKLYINGFDRYVYNGIFGNLKYQKKGLSFEGLLNILSSNNEILKKTTHLYENFSITNDIFFKYIDNVKSNFYGCNFDRCNIFGINFSSRIYNCTFLNSNFNSCNITYITDNCNFKDSSFKLSHISTGFTKCNFTNSIFNNCIFHCSIFDICDLTNSTFLSNTSEKCSIKFNKCCMENMDMSNNDLSNSILEIKECNTKNAKFNKCVVKELDSNLTFHVEFLLKGGEIKDTNFANSILTWIGQKIN